MSMKVCISYRERSERVSRKNLSCAQIFSTNPECKIVELFLWASYSVYCCNSNGMWWGEESE